MPNKIKDPVTDRVIVLIFILSFLFLISDRFFYGFLAGFMGILLIKNQEKAVQALAAGSAEVSYAGFWVRSASLIIDEGFSTVCWVTFFFIQGPYYFNYFLTDLSGLTWLAIEIYMLLRWGQSPGKMIMGIQVVKTDLSKITWKQVALREFFNIGFFAQSLLRACLITFGVMTTANLIRNVSLANILSPDFTKVFFQKFELFLGYWVMSEVVILLFNRKKRALHDYLAGTVVIVKEKPNVKYLHLVVISLVFFIGWFWYFTIRHDFYTRDRAEKGEPLSETTLGRYCREGSHGEPKNGKQAILWFQEAADQGDRFAPFYLGEIYEKGEGVPVDQAMAIRWYKVAAQNGVLKAKKALERLNAEFK